MFNNSSSAKLSDSYFLNTIWAELFLTLSGYSGLVENKLAELKLQIERKIETVLATLESDLGKFSPIKAVRLSSGLSVYYDARINEIIVKNLQLEFLIHDSWLPFSSLSDGTRRLFLLIADLSLKNRYYFRAKGFGVHQGEFNRIVLIEEPELGIHPHQLHQLMVFLKEQSVDKQLILTTHSPQVLDVLTKDELDAIIICEYDEEKKTQLRQLTEKEKKEALAYMEDSMYLSDFWRFSDLNKN